MLEYFYPIGGSLVLQGFLYYGFAWKFSQDFSIGVLVFAYILALVVFISGDSFHGVNDFMSIVMFTLIPSYIVISILSTLGKVIDRSIDDKSTR